jgi:UPF0042 nucleotide-binding protein
MQPPAAPQALDVAIVTGLSGAGRSTALRALEDAGWEMVDNLPIAMIPRLCEIGAGRPLAVGVDSRTRGFSAEALSETVAALRALPGVAPSLVFLDASDDALIARFGETRRRHPMAGADPVSLGVARERAVLTAARERADLVIDTTAMTPHDLKAEICGALTGARAPGLTVSLHSFAFKRGAPREAEMVFDVRFLRNPHWEPALRPRDGRDPAVAAYVEADPLFEPFFERLADMVLLLLPAYKREGKAYLGVGIGCTGGRHRSVTIVERLGRRQSSAGWRATVRHRELAARDGAGAGDGR